MIPHSKNPTMRVVVSQQVREDYRALAKFLGLPVSYLTNHVLSTAIPTGEELARELACVEDKPSEIPNWLVELLPGKDTSWIRNQAPSSR